MNFIRSNDKFTVIIDGNTYQFDKEHKNYDILVSSIKNSDEATFIANFSVGKAVQKWSEDDFVFKDGSIYYGEEPINDVICRIIFQMIEEGFNHKPILAFLRNLYCNPSKTSIDELYDWISNMSLAITDDGHFLAYKYVKIYSGDGKKDAHGRILKCGDFVDTHSQTYRNNIGDVNIMSRNKVDDNRNIHCGSGFHVGTLEYVASSPVIIICKVNPADVVSIPSDCGCQKLRCCKYEVVSNFVGKLKIVEK